VRSLFSALDMALEPTREVFGKAVAAQRLLERAGRKSTRPQPPLDERKVTEELKKTIVTAAGCTYAPPSRSYTARQKAGAV
jgi:hypothetical protein